MSGRQSNSEYWTAETANDNEPCRAIKAEGVVQCLRFLANEAEYLGYVIAQDILQAALAMQAEINAERNNAAGLTKTVSSPAVFAPTA